MRDSASVAPTRSLGLTSATFIISQVKLAGYFDLDHLLPTDPGRSVLAARALVGLAQGAATIQSAAGSALLRRRQRHLSRLSLPSGKPAHSVHERSPRRHRDHRRQLGISPTLRPAFWCRVLRRRRSGQRQTQGGAKLALRRGRGRDPILHAHRSRQTRCCRTDQALQHR